MILVNDDIKVATLSLSTADVTVILRGNTMGISGRLGSLALSNDSNDKVALSSFKQIMSIEGNNFAEFRYQTFDPKGEGYNGIKTSVYLNAASVKLHFLEQPLRDIYLFLNKLAKLKGLYDAATTVAVQKASEIEKMQFHVSVKSPIVVFPSNERESKDVLVMRLGEISARNSYDDVVNKIVASLRGIQLVSKIYYNDEPSTLKIIDDIDITSDILQTASIDRNKDSDYPDSQVRPEYLVPVLIMLTCSGPDCCEDIRHQAAANSSPVWLTYCTIAIYTSRFGWRARRQWTSTVDSIDVVCSSRTTVCYH